MRVHPSYLSTGMNQVSCSVWPWSFACAQVMLRSLFDVRLSIPHMLTSPLQNAPWTHWSHAPSDIGSRTSELHRPLPQQRPQNPHQFSFPTGPTLSPWCCAGKYQWSCVHRRHPSPAAWSLRCLAWCGWASALSPRGMADSSRWSTARGPPSA